MNDELWKIVNGYEGAYLVSNTGKVISTPRIVTREEKGKIIKQPLTGKTLSSIAGNGGHLSVSLCKDGKVSRPYVHSLVTEHMTREPLDQEPKVRLNPDIKNIFDFKFEDITVEGYDPLPAIKFPAAAI